ncbi:MAG: PAS domain-containing protein, partial [Halobacteriales archaeon]
MSQPRDADTEQSDGETASILDEMVLRAVDKAPVGLTISGPPEDDVPLIYANEAFTRLTGYRERDVIGRNCRFLQCEDTAAEPLRELREAIDAGKGASVELLNYRKDGAEFWNQVKIAPLRDENGTVTNYVGFQQDITERKRKQAQLRRQSEQFERFG